MLFHDGAKNSTEYVFSEQPRIGRLH